MHVMVFHPDFHGKVDPTLALLYIYFEISLKIFVYSSVSIKNCNF